MTAITIRTDLNNYWVSWTHLPSEGEFELWWPWWISGTSGEGESVCAAVQAASEDEAKEAVMAAYDVRPAGLEWRFVEKRPAGWTPYGDRFAKAAWMPEWPGDPSAR